MPRIKKGALFGIAAALFTIFPANVKAQMPNNPYTFELKPGATMSITVALASPNENAVSFWDVQRTDPRANLAAWPGCGTNDRAHPRSFQFTNNQSTSRFFAFNEGYKLAPQSSSLPWNSSMGRVLSYSNQSIKLGYENIDYTGGNTYGTTTITLTISAGLLPNGQVHAPTQEGVDFLGCADGAEMCWNYHITSGNKIHDGVPYACGLCVESRFSPARSTAARKTTKSGSKESKAN